MSAVDRDLGPNADVEYNIVPSDQEWLDAQQYFTINSKTGVIRIRKSVKQLGKQKKQAPQQTYNSHLSQGWMSYNSQYLK